MRRDAGPGGVGDDPDSALIGQESGRFSGTRKTEPTLFGGGLRKIPPGGDNGIPLNAPRPMNATQGRAEGGIRLPGKRPQGRGGCEERKWRTHGSSDDTNPISRVRK